MSLELFTQFVQCCGLLWFGAGQGYPYPSRLLHLHWKHCNDSSIPGIVPCCVLLWFGIGQFTLIVQVSFTGSWPMIYDGFITNEESSTEPKLATKILATNSGFCTRLVKQPLRIWTNYSHKSINTLRPRQNGRHFPDDIFKCIFLIKMFKFLLRFHWSLFPRIQLTIF